jgi:hypothetical protein
LRTMGVASFLGCAVTGLTLAVQAVDVKARIP